MCHDWLTKIEEKKMYKSGYKLDKVTVTICKMSTNHNAYDEGKGRGREGPPYQVRNSTRGRRPKEKEMG